MAGNLLISVEEADASTHLKQLFLVDRFDVAADRRVLRTQGDVKSLARLRIRQKRLQEQHYTDDNKENRF